MKVFQIGFNRCGTLSLCNFFNDNGHKAVHYDDGIWDNHLELMHRKGKKPLEGHDDVILWTDNDFIQRHFQYFHAIYPDSRFIYNIRDIDRWLASRRKFYQWDDSKQWEAEWYYREYQIKQFFKGKHAKRLLIFDIENDKGEDIANFLPELEWTNLDFPWSHKAS